MKYMGGKWRLRKWVADAIERERATAEQYWEPFCGSCAVAVEVVSRGLFHRYYASDVHDELIALHKAVSRGWEPPGTVTEDDHTQARRGIGEPHWRAFVLFGCSFGGDYKGGYAKDHRGDDYAGAAKRAVLRDAPFLKQIRFTCASYSRLKPTRPTVIYCDPPYDRTTGYRDTFDTPRFHRWAEKMSRDHVVLVSEYSAPSHWEIVSEKERKQGLRSRAGDMRIERVYKVRTK